MSGPGDDLAAALRAALVAIRKQQARIAELEAARSASGSGGTAEPIAIVGIGCRFPGGVHGPEAFWEKLKAGFDAVGDVPPDRWPVEDYFNADPEHAGTMYTRRGAFVDDVDKFDARFFGISPREAMTMDPQQRLLLETAWEAFEDAGLPPERLAGSATGVYVGLTVIDYLKLVYRDDLTRLDAYCATGNIANIAAGRLSYFFGLRGPAMTLDTACSSSLVSIHLACQSLRTGESTLALAAGVNLILAPDNSVAVSRARMLAPDGHCKTFDAAADGYARGEGVGVLVLKRLAQAQADGDRIHAVIRGTAVAQDGARSGLTVPNGPAQTALIKAALAAAGVEPSAVGYVEAHGTGTALGDPIEAEALAGVFGRDAKRTTPLVLGSLKTNVGHMESAAGVGGVIKVALALRQGEIPAHLHFKTENPEVRLSEIPAVIPLAPRAWPEGYARRLAGVSSFGSSGTIAHVVLEAPPAPGETAKRAPWPAGKAYPLFISAKTPSALRRLAARYVAFLKALPAGTDLADVCWTAATGRAVWSQRRLVTGRNATELAAALEREESGASVPVADPDAKTLFGDWTGRRVALPTYPFERERHWVEPEKRGGVAGLAEAGPKSGVSQAPGSATPVTGAGPKASAAKAPASARPATLIRSNAPTPEATGLNFGIMFFNGTERPGADSYRLFFESSRFADAHGFGSVWLPERHFTAFGGLYPNPATLHAALARETHHLRLMAGSSVLPLHDLRRLAEEWSVVDNLSNGRAGMSFASGWNPADFSLRPENYPDRHDRLFAGIEDLRKLWRGEELPAMGGDGRAVSVRIYPTPVQKELPLWVTAAGNPKTFARAGAAGAHVLTHLLDQDVSDLAEKIAAYRAARAAAGHDPAAGRVTVMLHSFIGADAEAVHAKVRAPFTKYLQDNLHLLGGLAASRGRAVDVATLSESERAAFVGFLYERFVSTRALLGTPESCAPLVRRLAAAGVTEIACLLDFGPADDDVLAMLPALAAFRATMAAELAGVNPGAAALAPRVPGGWHELLWRPVTLPSAAAPLAGRWTIAADRSGAGEALAKRLRAAGGEVALVPADHPIAATSADVLVNLRPLDVACEPVDTLAVVQATTAKLWTVTRGAQAAAGTTPDPRSAAQAALLRVLPVEQPQRWGGLVDLDPAQPVEAQIDALASVLRAEAREDQLALRGGEILAARLVTRRAEELPSGKPFVPRADATYLITGGLSGVGWEVARWLVTGGARHLLLLARREPDAAQRAQLATWAEAGVTVTAAAVDVSDRAALERVLAAQRLVRQADRPTVGPSDRLAGVFHAAGVWRDAPLAELTPAQFAETWAAKVEGARHLDALLGDTALDVFVGFSAFSAVLPAPGQGNYAAANAALDALIRQRRARGASGLTLNWGPWSEVGFAATEYGRRAHARLESLGITRFGPADGVATLAHALGTSAPQLAVMRVDWTQLFTADPQARLSPLLRELLAAHAPADAVAPAEAGRIVKLLAGKAATEQLGLLTSALASVVAAVLRMRVEDVPDGTAMTELGVDSLVAIEIKNRIQLEAGVDVPLTTLLEGPSCAKLAGSLLAQVKVAALARTVATTEGPVEEIEL